MRGRQALDVRREELIALCAMQRRDVAFAAGDIGRSVWFVNAALVASRRAAAHPALLAGFVVAAAVVLRPGRILRLLIWGLPAMFSARHAATRWLRHTRGAPLDP